MKKAKTTPAKAYTLEFQKGEEWKVLTYVNPCLVVSTIKAQLQMGYVLTCVTAERW